MKLDCNSTDCSVPDTSGSMVRNGRLTSLLFLLGQVVQEKVDQDSIDFSTWIIPNDFSANHFHGPDAAATELHLIAGIVGDGLLRADCAV